MNAASNEQIEMIGKIEKGVDKISSFPNNYLYPFFNSVFVLQAYGNYRKQIEDIFQGKEKYKTIFRIFLFVIAFSYFSLSLFFGFHKVKRSWSQNNPRVSDLSSSEEDEIKISDDSDSGNE